MKDLIEQLDEEYEGAKDLATEILPALTAVEAQGIYIRLLESFQRLRDLAIQFGENSPFPKGGQGDLKEVTLEEALKLPGENILVLDSRLTADDLYIKTGGSRVFISMDFFHSSESINAVYNERETTRAHYKNCRFFVVDDATADRLILSWAKGESLSFINPLIPKRKEATS